MLGLGGMMALPLAPGAVSSQSLSTVAVQIEVPCTMTAKLWGGGAYYDQSGAGGYAAAAFSLQPGDVVTYAAGGTSRLDGGTGGYMIGGTSGSGLGNGGSAGLGGVAGAGRTELYINGVLKLVAGGGGGAAFTNASSGWVPSLGGGGGGANGQAGQGVTSGGSSGGQGATQSGPGAGGPGYASGPNGSSGSGGAGGNSGTPGGAGGGGGGFFGGGGGGVTYDTLFGRNGAGGGGSGYDSTGAGTLIAASGATVANAADPDRVNNAGSTSSPGLVVLKFIEL